MKKISLLPIFLILFGFISVFTIYKTTTIDSYANGLFYKQFAWYIMGFILIMIVVKMNNSFFFKISKYLYIINNLLLLFLLIFGKPINGAKCWFTIPGIGAFQPSELMKVSLILVLTSYLANTTYDVKNELKVLFNSFLLVLIPSILTFLEPDTGNVMIYFVIYITIIFTYGFRLRYFITSGVFITIIIFTLGFVYFNFEDLFIELFGSSFFLRIDRLLDWKNGDGFQLEKSIISMGSTGLLGSLKIPLYYPESYTDFIFTSFASLFGFLGSIFLLLCIIIFDYLIINISFKSNKKNELLINGICGMILYQQVQNISMTFGLLPITGITLPFISYGGSSLLCYMFLIGLVINIDKENKKMLNYKHF